MGSLITAEAIGQAAKFDQQLVVPQRPSVRRGVELRHFDDSELLVGVVKPQVLTGEFARTHLRSLLDLCDGTRDLDELAQLAELPSDSVFTAIGFLWACGVVEDAAGSEVVADVPDSLAVRLSRLGDSTGANSHWTRAAARLRATKIHVTGDRQLSAELERVVVRAGGNCVDTAYSDSDLVVLVETGPSEETAHLAATCWANGIPLLRICFHTETLEVGPFVDPAFTPCLDCSNSALTSWEEPASELGPRDHDPLALGLAAHQVLALISRAVPSHLPMDVRVTDLESLTVHHVPPTSRAGCPTCGSARGVSSPSASLAAIYEQSVAIPPRRFVDTKGHQAHYQSSNLALQHQFRHYPSCPTLRLPDEDVLAGSASPDLTLAHLATILRYCAGLRPQGEHTTKVRRWTAAGGNIGSVIAHVIVRDPALAPPGTYAYVERDHRLALLSHETPGPQADALLVLNGDVAKVSRKYGSFALRICLQDAGCSALVARRVADCVGVRARPVAHWDDDVFASAFATSPVFEPVTSVLALGGDRAH